MGSTKEKHEEDSSSEEEDGDEQWRAAINSVASANSLPSTTPSQAPLVDVNNDDQDAKPFQPQVPKHYQIKAQKVLDDIVEKSLVYQHSRDIVDNDNDKEGQVNDGGVRLFKRAPKGIVFDRDEPKGPTKKPRLLPHVEIDEKSKQFKRQLQSVVVDGTDILASAKDANQKALARLQAKEAAAKEAAKREEERVAQLKKIRGERWLPSIARYMQVKKPTVVKHKLPNEIS